MNDQTGHFVVRRATPADSETILQLHVDSIRRICAASYTPEQIDAWAGSKRAEKYTQGMASGDSMFVAESTGPLLGFAALRGDNVLAVYVSPDHQHRGVGKALLAALEDDARQRHILELHLESTLNALDFYASRGFRRVGPSIRIMHGVEVPCEKMSKRLG
jgi:GNAT superfamily N-acetyltransferase